MSDLEIEASERLFAAMKQMSAKLNWRSDIYGNGPSPRAIEVQLTNSAMQVAGIAEISKPDKIPHFAYPKELASAFQNIAALCGVKPRVDGYLTDKKCFVEAKVSKIDVIRGSRGGRSIYDIGQWAYDIIKLQEIGDAIPSIGIVYSIVAIAKDRFGSNAASTKWTSSLFNKAHFELSADLKRESSELMENHPFRSRQLLVLQNLLRLDPTAFAVAASDKWAVMSFNVRRLNRL